MLQVPRVLLTDQILIEKGSDTVATASVAVPIPAFDTTTVAVKLEPARSEFDDRVDVIERSTVEVALVTVTVATADVLAALFASPLYTAVNACVPTVRLATVATARPPVSGNVTSGVAPSRNCTVPVAEDGETEAVRSTLWPYLIVPLLAVTLVVVAALATGGPGSTGLFWRLP
jgi:hypothetical protein